MNTRRKHVALITLFTLATATVLTFFSAPQAVPEPTDSVGSAQPSLHPAAHRQEPITRLALDSEDQAARGTRMTFAFDVVSDLDLGEQTMTTRLAGEMNVLVLGRRDDKTLAEVRFPGLRASIDGQASPTVNEYCEELSRSLGQPTAVLIGTRGETLGYRFPAGAISDHRNWIRTLVSAFRFVQGPEGERSWSTTEADATGVAQVEYLRRESSAADFELLRRRVLYTDVPRCEPGGQAVAQFRDGLAWPVAAKVADRALVRIPEAGVEANSLFSATLELLSIEQVRVGDADWSGAWATASGRDEVSEVAQESSDEAWRQRLAGVQVHELVQRISELLAQEPLQEEALLRAIETLAHLVRLRPDALAELEPLLRDGSTDAHVFGVITNALSRAGTDAAQDALADTAENATLPPHLRRASLEAMFSLEEADAETVERVGRLLTGSVTITEIEGTAMLLLGAFADRDCGVLLGTEAMARDQGALPLWLESLGNAGTTDVLEPARRYSKAADETLRAMAMTALRQVDSEDALALLTHTARVDESAVVRSRAVQALVENPAGASFDTLASIAASDPHEDVRYAAITGLIREAKSNPQAKAFLERRVAEETSPDLQQFLRDILAG